MDTTWRQITVTFPDWDTAEHTALTHLVPRLTTTETTRLIGPWFFLRKTPGWRIRYQPPGDSTTAENHLLHTLGPLQRARHITAVTPVIYEPETHAFGGPEAMTCAHRLFHLDSHHLIAHLTRHPDRPHRRELAILLCTALLRAAGLDWYEQGDVWARVADHRDPPPPQPDHRLKNLRNGLRHLMTADITQLTREDAPLPLPADWPQAFTTTGQDLTALANAGRLHRGLRAVLAHHIIFAFNRLGLPHATQATLAASAKAVVFGADPATEDHSAPGAPV
ncbi:thiopeptide-type bacteriocin biosynthesis protein [Streptomyces aidingensis]|uniref:Thiopeptide-type bacteriocin biosynthesis domain-containing protein n=1 Tax=Streptomyces aidingensis TaxID=910347 RepID=A0A1I1U2H9_9ACTN|nr:thiopeptide-type bacteriocin biosynthesis protein [Streptomyces aidingensis]SFD64914.1 thiopeptide-type bacteriocin biosynthesis domain-containing protein [Streptomyces aidingensis]